MKSIRLSRAADDRHILQAMVRIRAIETVLAEASLAGDFEGPVHVSFGQEAVAVGLGLSRRSRDKVYSSHRGHHHALALGLDPRRLMAEVIGHKDGFQRGHGGSMHLFSPSDGFMGTNGIVGDSAALALGTALALQRDGSGAVVFALIGDGAMGAGSVYEAMNIAALWRLPVAFVCESNGYAEMTATAVHLATDPLPRAGAFGLEVVEADGTDARDVEKALKHAIDHAGKGQPSFVKVNCLRLSGHYVGDAGHYRPEGELKRWQFDGDPITRLATTLDIHSRDLTALSTEAESQARNVLAELIGPRTRGGSRA